MKQKLSEKKRKKAEKSQKSEKKVKKAKKIYMNFASLCFTTKRTWDTWGGVSRSPRRCEVDTYGLLCGPPHRYMSHFLVIPLAFHLSFCKSCQFPFLSCRANYVLLHLHLSGFQQCFEGLLTFCCSGTVRKTVSSANCPRSEGIFPDIKSEVKRKIWSENKRKEAIKEKWNFIVK